MGYEESKARLAEDLLTRRRAVASAAPVDAQPLAYDPTPLAQLAPEPEAGYLRGTAASLIRGVAQIPVAGGNALEANPEADLTGGPRTLLNRVGTVMSDASERVRDSIQAPNYGKNEVKRSVFGGAESLPLSTAYMVPSVIGAVAGEALNPFGGGFVGSAAASAATYPIMQKSTYQETYEQIKKLEAAGQLKPGTTEADIVAAATKAGHYEAGPEAATNAIEGIIYGLVPGGKALNVAKNILGKSAAKQFGKNFLKSAAVEVPSEMVTGAGQQSAVNDITANPTTTPLEATIDTIGPTLAMTAFTAGGGTAAQRFKAHLDTVAEKLDTPRGNPADPTPRAAALLAGVPATPVEQFTLPPGLPDLLGQQPDTIMDSENFTGQHATDLLARREAAEARNAAAFDSANPVVPNAPDNTPVGNPYTQFAPAPSPAFEATALDPKNTYVPQVIPELGPPPAAGGNVDLGLSTPASQAPAAPAASTSTAADYTQTTPDESHALFMERHASDPDGWVQAMNTRANRGESDNAHENRVSALARYDELLASGQARQLSPAPEQGAWNNDPLGVLASEPTPDYTTTSPQDTQLAGVDAMRADPAQWTAAMDATAIPGQTQTEHARAALIHIQNSTTQTDPTSLQTDQYDAMDYQQLGTEAVRRATGEHADAWDAAMTQVDAEASLGMRREDRYRLAMREHDARIAAATPQAGQGVRPQAWMADREPITDQERESQQLAVDIIGSDRWHEIREEVRAEADAVYGGDSSGDVSTRATRRESLRRAELEAANHHQNPNNSAAPTNFTPEQYDTMNYGELNVEFNAREQQNPALANSCYAYAVDNSTPGSTQADWIRAALREFDFRQANPVANNPPNVLPTWADINAPLEADEAAAYSELRVNPDLTAHVLAIRTEVVDELVSAGENPTRYDYAIAREIMRRFKQETTRDVQGTPYTTAQSYDGTFMVVDSNGDVVGRGFYTRDAAYTFAQHEFASTITSTPVPTVPTTTPAHMAFENSSVFRVASGIFNASYNGGTDTPTRDAVRLIMSNPSLSIAESADVAMRPIADVIAAETDTNVLQALRDIADNGYASIADALHYVNAQERTAYEAVNAPPSVPASGADAIARIGDFTAPVDFIAYLYGDAYTDSSVSSNVDLSQHADDMYRTDIQVRIDRASGWPASNERERVLSVLSDIRDMGYATIRDAHVGAAPSVRVTPPQNIASPEVRAAIMAPTTTEESTRSDDMVTKALNLVRGAMNGAPTTGNEVAKAWHSAFKKVWKAVANNIEEYRYGAVPASANTIQSVVDTINAYAIQKGRNIRLKITGSYLTATTVPRGTNFTFQTSNDGGNTWGVAMTTSSTTSTGSTNAMNTNNRGAGDAGLGYYAMHVVARNVAGATFQSSGMTSVNQLRRVEHAFNELARHGGAARAIGVAANINELGSGSLHGYHELTRGAVNALTAVAARSYAKIIKVYPQLGRYKFDFATGNIIHIESGRTVPVEFITGHIRTGRSLNDPIFRVAQSGNLLEGFSDSVVNRALITQEIIRTENREGKPNAAQITRFANAVRDAAAYNQPILYNRTGETKATTTMKADTLAKGMSGLTKALDSVIAVNVIQSQDHFPGWHEGMPAFNAAYHNGAIYVVADQVESVAEAKKLILDHELRHAGLRQVLGKSMDTFLKQAWYAQTDVIKGFANSKGIDTSTTEGRLEAAEEFIVSLAQEAKTHPLLDRAIAKIRSLLRAIGFDLNLSRAELRAMVAKAGMLKESVGQDGETRFSRTDTAAAQAPIDNTVAGFYRSAREKFKAMRNAARGAEWVTQKLMPVDRLIDLALLNSVYKPLHALLPVYTRLQREMQNIQDQIVGDAGRRFEKYEAACGTKAERDNFNSVMRDGTLWGIYPEGGKVTWTAEEWGVRPAGHESTWTEEQRTKWEATQAFKTGLSLHQAFTNLNDRYNSMTEAQRTQYHAAINDMEKLRTRYQKSMQDFVKKITPETTLENATRTEGVISLLGPDGRQYTTSRNRQGMWDLRSGDNRILKTAPELEEVAEGLAPQGKREKLLGKVNQKFKDIKGPYAPLSRFGNIVVNVYESTTDPAGEVSEDRTARYHFEKESDAQEMMARMRAEGFKVTIEEAAQSKSMRAQVPSEFITELDGAIERMGAGMEDEQRANLSAFGAQIREDMERIWLSMTPESSALKHTMKRTGLAGFDEDMMRGYVGYAQRHARGIAYLDRGIAIRETVKEMRAKIDEATDNSEDARASKRMVDHLENHEATVRGEKLSDLTQKLTRFPFLWYLSSPSVFLVQSSQPFIMTLPKLAVKFGYGKSLAAITRAYAMQANMKDQPFANKRLDAWHPTAELYVNRQAEGLETTSLTQGLSHDELTLLGMAIAVKRGQIDVTMTHEAMNILKGNIKGIGDKITEKAAFLMQLSELMSRKAAFAATFEMEMERHGDFTKAVDNSVEVLRDTLYDYSRANRPGFMLGNAGRILFQFQIFRVHTLSKMLQLLVSSCTGDNKKAAIKEFSMMMGNTMAVAGISGLPFLSTAMGAFAFVFGDDDEPWDFDVYMRSLVGDGVVGDALLKGAPTLFGMDVSRRVGMGGVTDLFAGDPPAGVHGAQLYSYYAGKALGPLGGVASDVLFKAPELAKQGMWTELAEQTTPKPIKDLMTGYNTMFGEGKYTGKGKLLVDSADMTVWDSVLAMGGINPAKISNAQERNYNAQKLSSTISERRSVLQKQLQRAVISQDPDQINGATDKIAEFNGKMPQFAITKQQIAAGVKRALRKEMGLEDKNLAKVKQKYEIGQGA